MNDNYVKIDTKIIKNNVENIIKKYNNYKYYIGVVKGNAYGHGMGICKYLVESGINYLAVSSIEEALEVRKYVKVPILILQPVNLDLLEIICNNNLTLTVSSIDYFNKIKETNLKIKIHLKLDTGMNRLGICDKNIVNNIYNECLNNKNVELEGIYSHFATIGISDTKFDKQINNFKLLTSDIDLNKIKIIHFYSTNGVVMHPKLSFTNAVRLGIIMYGFSPRKINYNGLKGKLRKIKTDYLRNKYNIYKLNNDINIDVHPALSLISKIIEIKFVNKDEYIGYGLKYKTNKDIKIGIIPLGYSSGIPYHSSFMHVIINNKKYKVIGSINMNMMIVEIDNDVKLNDEVIVIGENIREIASLNHLTPHVVLASISFDLKRIYK